MTARIILIDDHPEAGRGLAAYLARHGLAAETCGSVTPALERLGPGMPCLVLLHRWLRVDPDLGPLRQLRAASSVPAILRAMDSDDEADRVLALELGADDYVAHGTSAREVLARIRTVLRRSQAQPPHSPESAHGWRLCPRQREAFGPDGRPCHLTAAEFTLLLHLVRLDGVVADRDTLSQVVLRRPFRPEDRAIDNLVLRLRRKLGDTCPPPIKSVRGAGYVFVGFPQDGPVPRDAPAAQPWARTEGAG